MEEPIVLVTIIEYFNNTPRKVMKPVQCHTVQEAIEFLDDEYDNEEWREDYFNRDNYPISALFQNEESPIKFHQAFITEARRSEKDVTTMIQFVEAAEQI